MSNTAFHAHSAAGPEPELARSAGALRVLVVDDEPLIRWSITEILGSSGHIVTSADSAAAALGAVVEADGELDVVLLDYRLPDSQGLELLAIIRRMSPRAAVVMMTAESTPEIIDAACALGASQVIEKPFDMHDVPALVQEVYESRAA